VNAGTGEARTFKAVAQALMAVHGEEKIEYIPFPGDLMNRYQHFTQADPCALQEAGYNRTLHLPRRGHPPNLRRGTCKVNVPQFVTAAAATEMRE
jgi:hypothetical protein